MRVLLIEDDRTMARSLSKMLTSEGLNCEAVETAEEGLELAELYSFDIILLDLMLPDMDGEKLLRRLRGRNVRAPVLVISGVSSLDSKLKTLSDGADDYLVKPFDKRELIARIQAIVRRSKGHSDSVIEAGGLKVNLDTRTVTVNDQHVHLSAKEYGIMELMALRKGVALSKETFLNHLYGGMDEPELKIIDVFVCKVRRKLSDAGSKENFIETVWGRGYMLRDPAPEVQRIAS